MDELGEGQEYQEFFEEFLFKKTDNKFPYKEFYIILNETKQNRVAFYPEYDPPKTTRFTKNDRVGWRTQLKMGCVVNRSGDALLAHTNRGL